MNPSLTDSRRQALRSASHWYAVLSGERVSPQQEARWQQWYEQDQDNQWAWQQVENLRNQLGGVPGDVASRALHDTRLTRRHVMKGFLASAPAQKRIVNAGESLQFSASEFGAVKPLDDESTSWTKGILSFSDKPLGEVIATLSRYRNGVLRCDPAVAGLRLSGTFPLKNTDAILNVIAQTLPVKIQSITRYWINISPL
ncbi:DUF4880 domain-containing protein [Klebsiella pneumoniae]|uniref:DUF4880 domain-containing protein n=1 Tax=Klebsiella pneumoniae TaxID=573 RepID=UPI000E2BC6C2|nr:DUF4880 domain-containing protein [Klebsiella pneumoniae]SXM47528.1 fec operon regulator FecR [Klebsiella pneumoniae]